jgi:hypothetical protein
LQAEKAFLKMVKENFLLLTDGSVNRKLCSEKTIREESFKFFLSWQVEEEYGGCCQFKDLKSSENFLVHLLITTPRILVRCHIGDPVTIQCVDAQSGLRLFFNLELTVCPKR